ncbi:cobyrinate a,c-diamide synthase [Garciella nitratireducens]|uniref:cobyrinate a,c-diamide synthase n=1 Tax=Garciella nitratireducens TaxID=218205 RepID=UPI000DFA0D7C|nr:cobyrinate a,c-diamide synthase [Garciella nitratireducens]RBP41554.1 cobyrinic acid a,c-diamide synthase [Garciella nitratireducens]
MNGVMIAATSSGVGKTTLSLGLMAAFEKRGLKVQPFKVGPDYIDPEFHKLVTQKPSYNLDSWMLEEDILKFLFYKNMDHKDIAIIEGVMGLYDGIGAERQACGSSAQISKILEIPVILVIDGSSMSSSAAAIVLGYQLYDPKVKIQGIIINKVSGQAHYDLLKEAIERDTHIKCLGYLPKDLNLSLNSRHLGLVPVEEIKNFKEKIDRLVIYIEKYIDLEEILKLSQWKTSFVEIRRDDKTSYIKYAQGLRLGILKDKAFHFYYQDNIDLLRDIGVELKWISPLKEKKLPKDLDGLYLGGGFPEIFAKELEENQSFRESVYHDLESGLPAYGECGGLMYLTQKIQDLEGKDYEMVGFFPTKSIMTKRLQHFGYVEVETQNGLKIKAHEFHHSKIVENKYLSYCYQVRKKRKGKIIKEWKCGITKKNVLAAYPHIHFYSNIEFLKKFLKICKNYQKRKSLK